MKAVSLRSNFAVGGYGDGVPMEETITVNGPEHQEKHSYAQQRQGFAVGGFGDGVPMKETITVNGPEHQEQHSYAQQK